MIKKQDGARVMVRLPRDQKAWLEEEAARNWTSQNAEIVKAIRMVMESEPRPAAVG